LLVELARYFVIALGRPHKLSQIFIREHLEKRLDEMGYLTWEWNPTELLKADLTAVDVLEVVFNANVHLERRLKLPLLLRYDLVVASVCMREDIGDDLANLSRHCLQG